MNKEELELFEDICSQAVEISHLIDDQKEEYEKIGLYISDVQKIENMDPEKRQSLSEYSQMASIIENDKIEYRQESEIITNMEYHTIIDEEKNLPKILKNMEDNEKRYSMVKGDLRKLEGERQVLEIEGSYLVERRRLLQGLLKVVITTTIILMVVYLLCSAGLEMDVTLPVYITLALAALAIAGLLFSVGKLKKEMTIMELKKKKALGLQNKIKIKYVNAYNGLDYMYEKYDVNSAYELNKKWENYDRAKRGREVYKEASSRLYDLNKKIIEILEAERLYDSAIWLTQLSAFYKKEDLEKIKSSLYSQRQGIRKKIEKNVSAMDTIKEKIKKMIGMDSENAKEMMKILEKYDEF